MSFHHFAAAGGATALPYLDGSRAVALGGNSVDLGLFGDQSLALAGPAYNGDEVTIYARRGTTVLRATGIAPNGDPAADIVEAALFASLPEADRVPAGLRLAEEHARSASSLAATFADPDEAEQLFQSWDWRESAARVFVADGSGTAAGTARLKMVVFRLGDARAAEAALPSFLEAGAVALGLSAISAPQPGDESRAIAGALDQGREATVYVRDGSSPFRITAVGAGDPMADLEVVLA